ncbi:MAG: hypothetical protein ACE5K2_04220 [Candidatus Zixiibacteriota bacterium]
MGRVYDTVVLDSKSLHALFDSGAVHNYLTKEAAGGLTTQVIPEPFAVGLGGTVSDACLVVGRVHDRLFDFLAQGENLDLSRFRKEFIEYILRVALQGITCHEQREIKHMERSKYGKANR